MITLLTALAFAGTVAPTATLTLGESWPAETTLDHADIADASDVWYKLVTGAKTSIDLDQFYVSSETGSKLDVVIDELKRAAGRGVKIRLVVDSKMSKTYPEPLASLDAVDNVEVRKVPYETLTGGVQHAKFFVVDNKIAWVGSQNFDWRSLQHVQELGFSIDAPGAVAMYAHIFGIDWELAGGASLEAAVAAAPKATPVEESVLFGGDTLKVTALGSPTGYLGGDAAWDLPVLLDAINKAQTSIRMQALSYERIGYDKVEWHDLDDALRAAAVRGVKVEMIVANWSKSGDKLASVQSLERVPGIAVKFANIPEASTGFIPFARVVHSKYITIDGSWSWIGTSNFGRDYFYESRNVALVVKGASMAKQLDTLFEGLWTSPYAEVVDPARTDYQPPKKK